MAKSGVENALWDVEAQLKGVPLYELLGGTMDEIAAGVSLGIREKPGIPGQTSGRRSFAAVTSASN